MRTVLLCLWLALTAAYGVASADGDKKDGQKKVEAPTPPAKKPEPPAKADAKQPAPKEDKETKETSEGKGNSDGKGKTKGDQEELSHGRHVDWGLCKQECESDKLKIITCIKSDGGKIARLALDLHEKCSCAKDCQYRKDKLKELKEEEKKQAKPSREDLMKFRETFEKIVVCERKAGVREMCIPGKDKKE